MVEKLREKFVVVTTSLMIIVFGIFLLASYLYNDYWDTLEMADFLDLVADSGLFLQEGKCDAEERILNAGDGENPIIGLIMSEKGEILDKKIVGKESKADVPNNVVSYILENGPDRYKAGSYLYSYRKLDDGNLLIVLTKFSMDANWAKKALGALLLIPCGILVLVALTFFLSRFVTEPAKQALMREKQFISDASHELKTPLGAISINAQVLDRQYPENLYVKNIVSESKRMGRLIERLLTLSKLEEEDVVSVERISLSEITEEMSLTYESTAFEKQLDYHYQVEEDIFIKGNADELRQVMAILLDNAIKNTDALGIVEISCKSNRGKAIVSVKNTGQGISPEDLPHVFERFYTSDFSRKENSFGLGLAIAKAIVDRYGGCISVDSIPGRTTEFTVSFRRI